jgi:LEA14-like dessication related protein
MPGSRLARPRRSALVALLASGFCASACGQLLPPRDLVPPTLQFEDVAIDSISLERVRFLFRIATRNPNAVDLPLSNVYFELALLGKPVAQGMVPEQRFVLPAQGTRSVPVSLSVAAADMRELMATVLRGELDDAAWSLKGTANWGASPLPIPFEKRGDARSLKKLRELLGR